MMGLYIHMIYTVKTSASASAASKVILRSRMTRMVGVVCCTLIICYAPNQILWVFALAGKVKLDSKVHHVAALLTFVASCVNPVVEQQKLPTALQGDSGYCESQIVWRKSKPSKPTQCGRR